jgi:hypothetical protein
LDRRGAERLLVVLLVAPVTAITVDAERRVIADAGLVVSGTRIEAVGKATDRAARYPRAPRLARPGVDGDD